MKKNLTLMFVALFSMIGWSVNAQKIVDIPANNINWENAKLVNANSENSGANVGSTGANTEITFLLNNTTEQGYIMEFKTGTKNEADVNVSILNEEGASVFSETFTVVNTGNWTPSVQHQMIVPILPVGEYSLVFKTTRTTGSYAGNWGDLCLKSAAAYDRTPGTLSLAKGNYTGGARTENNDDNVGWLNNGTGASYTFINDTAGVYNLVWDFWGLGDGSIDIVVTDKNSGRQDVNTTWEIVKNSDYEPMTILLPGKLEPGMKTISFAFHTTSTWACNYKAPKLEKYVDNIALVRGVAIEGLEVKAGETTDYLVNIPNTYAETVTFGADVLSADLTVTAKDADGADVAVTANGDGTYTLATPAANSTTIVSMKVSAQDNAIVTREEWTMALFHIGEIQMTALSIDGTEVELPADINTDPCTATISGGVYTAVPTVKATFIDGSTATGVATVSGTTATFAIEGKIGEDTRNFTVNVEGLNIYQRGEKDEVVELKYTGEGKQGDGNWSNGLYTLESSSLDGWNNDCFKLNAADGFTWRVPTDVVIKQIIFKKFNANYNGGELTSITSDGATMVIPSKHDYQEPDATSYDLVINVENHQAGAPFSFVLTGGGQPVAWFQLVVEKVAVASAPEMIDSNITSTDDKNHFVASLSFDREMTTTEATIDGRTIVAEGGSSTLNFAVWNLEYEREYILTIPAGAAKDTYGNGNTEAIEIPVLVGPKAVAEKAVYDYVVSTVDEFKAAVTAVNNENKQDYAPRKTIFIKNGDYDFGSAEQRITAYNVSLIGESRDGVILHGKRTGISNPVLNLRDRTGFYLQDLTVRNDLPLGDGVGVAIYGGNKTAMKNVRMLGFQDTQVTGHRAYFEECEIHGTVDFICGGGDNYYYKTDLVLENRGGNCITAPSTSSTLKWGYVFESCTISAAEGAEGVVDGTYNLGRPWQDTPRSNFLNTTMKVLPTDGAWTSMSNLPTYFYEYNSLKADGSKVDLSKRANSPTSTNSYTPVLTDEQAAVYTLQNVLGGTDSWLPTEETVIAAAPAITLEGDKLSWADADDARCYVIFCDGEYVTNQAETSYTIAADGKYTVRAANVSGGLGLVSNEVNYTASSAIDEVEVAATPVSVEYYNAAGMRIAAPAQGVNIKRSLMSDGAIVVEKVIVK